jgi:hypothetical protein
MLQSLFPSNDYPVRQSWKRHLFRRGKLPMGDLHEILAHVDARRAPQDTVFRRYLSNVSRVDSPNFQAALASIDAYRNDEFFRLFNEEAAAQWDRIVDRRFSGVLFNMIFLAVGFVLGRL